ncbi:hypothetical protein G9A89_014093 [Geosiphon pyriformis]|nr:hypothetical protein G9A89_014093 [Geosiphon pyriformis]
MKKTTSEIQAEILVRFAAFGGKLLDVAVLQVLKLESFGCGLQVFKPSFAGSKFYAKAAAFMVSPIVATTDMDLNLSGSSKTTTLMLPAVSSASNFAVKFRLAFLKSHFSKLSVLIKFLVKSVGALVVLVTKLLSIPTVMDVLVKKYVAGLAKQNKNLAAIAFIMQKRITRLEKKYE